MTILNVSSIYGVLFQANIIPKGNSNRSGRIITVSYITIHTTENKSAGANADAHARFASNGGGSAGVSWHFTVDKDKIIQHLPLNEQGYHAGTSAGNNSSIGIEITENSDGDFEQATNNAARLVKYLMNYFGFGINHIVPHQHWSGKYCPRPILDRGFSWFINKVNNVSDSISFDVEKPIQKQGIGFATSKYPEGWGINLYTASKGGTYNGRINNKLPYVIFEGVWYGGDKNIIRLGWEKWAKQEHFNVQWFYAYSKYPSGYGINTYDGPDGNYTGYIDGSVSYSIYARKDGYLDIGQNTWVLEEHFDVK